MAKGRHLYRLGLRGKFLTAFLGLTAVVLAAAFLAAEQVSDHQASMALERGARFLAVVQADAVGELLERARLDLFLLAEEDPTDEAANRFLAVQSSQRPGIYREVAYVPANAEPSAFFVDTGHGVGRVTREQTGEVLNSPVLALTPDSVPDSSQGPVHGSAQGAGQVAGPGTVPIPAGHAGTRPGGVILTGFTETLYPAGIFPELASALTFGVIRLAMPVEDQEGRTIGTWVLSVDGQAVRDILAVHNSPRTPLADMIRGSGGRSSFFLDSQGWVLFQSSGQEVTGQPSISDPSGPSKLSGPDLPGGPDRPGYPGAFRPAGAREDFWRVVQDIQAGRSGSEVVEDGLGLDAGGPGRRFLGFVPVMFRGRSDDQAVVAAGVVVMDTPRSIRAWGDGPYQILLFVTASTMVLSTALALMLARAVARPIRELTAAVQASRWQAVPQPIELPDRDRDTTALRMSINNLVEAVVRPAGQTRLESDGFADQPGSPTSFMAGEPTASRWSGPEEPRDSNGSLMAIVKGDRPALVGGTGAIHSSDSRSSVSAGPVVPPGSQVSEAPQPQLAGLNERQLKGLAYLRERGTMSRANYQAITGDVPQRTAQHDLRDLVERGLLDVKGKGPATRYVPAGEAKPGR
jgi:hypothetical protein